MGCTETPPVPVQPHWTVQPVETTARFQAVSAVDENTLWTSGTGGTYARTLDGGATWTAAVVPGADSLEFRDVHAVDALTAYLLSAGPGTASRIYKTTDGGQTWTLQFTNAEPEGFFDCMDFWTPERGLAFSDAVNGRLLLITTNDGGATWQPVPPENIPPALEGEGAFAASGTCLLAQSGGHAWIGTGASGIEARVFHTADYGRTWTVATTPIASDSGTSGIFSLAFRDALHGAALGGDFGKPDENRDNVAVTDDGGRTWTMVGATQLPGAVFGATYVPGAPTPTLLAVGPTGSDISTDNGRTWARIDTLNYWAVTAVGSDAAWAVGPGGRVTRLTW